MAMGQKKPLSTQFEKGGHVCGLSIGPHMNVSSLPTSLDGC